MERFQYTRATTIPEAIGIGAQSATAQQGAPVRFLAGGTTLVDLMKLNVEHPTRVVDINLLGLNTVERTADGGRRIGALVRNAALAHDPSIVSDYRVLSEALLSGASAQLRNVATTGGNLLQRTLPRDPRHQPAVHRHQSIGHERRARGVGGHRARAGQQG